MRRRVKLISKADLARLAGVSRAAVTQQCKRRLAGAVRANRVDLAHPEVQRWLADLRGADLDRVPSEPIDAEGFDAPTPLEDSASEVAESDSADRQQPADFGDYADMTLRELTKRFGTARAFSDWLDGMRKLEMIRGQRIQNEETEGLLIDRDMVQTHVFGTLDGMCRRLLTDACKTIARRLDAAANAGESVEARELIAQEIIGSIIQPAKDQAAKALRGS